MQEEVENRTVSLVISGSKFSGRLLKAAISKYLAYRKETKAQKSRDHPEVHGGQVSMAELQAQYGLKHNLQRDTGLYLTNNEFKDAMLMCGYPPVDANKLNWYYCISKKSRAFLR